MSQRAWAYIFGILLAGLLLSIAALSEFDPAATSLTAFAVLTALATLAQFFQAEAPHHQLYSVNLVFIFAAVLLLDPFLFVLLVTLSHGAGWIKERLTKSPYLRNWYLQPFNMAVHLIAGFAARSVFIWVNGSAFTLILGHTVVAVAAAVIVYTAINHAAVGMAISLARGIPLRKSGVLARESLQMDAVLMIMGASVSVLWTIHPFMILLALSPLLLAYQVLKIPQLRKEAFTDEKTGLWNSRHFAKLLIAETERAKRFNRPLAFIMADLDLLRNINNTYGHLAGDAVLSSIGQIIRNSLRDYDIAGRFGGEEFAIALPETNLVQARAIAERIREAIQATRFEASTSATPIRATMSLGVACFTQDASTPTTLIHEADIAVYQAKLKGRNRVVCASEVPHSTRLNSLLMEDRIKHPFVSSFTPRPESIGEPPAAPAPASPPNGSTPLPWLAE
ncbi:MAG: diguanylate cyclase [Acidobacteriota bacterium]